MTSASGGFVKAIVGGGVLTLAAAVLVSCGSAPIAAPRATVTVSSVSTVTMNVTAEGSNPPAPDPVTVTETATETETVTNTAAPVEAPSESSAPSAADDGAGGTVSGKMGAALPLTWSGYDDSGNPTTSTGTVTLYSAKWMTDIPGQFEQKPEKGAFLILDVGFVGKTGAVPYNPFDFTVKDAAGHEYDGAYAQLDEPELSSGKLKVGAKARGSLVFDLPRGAVTLTLAPSGSLRDDLATWAIAA